MKRTICCICAAATLFSATVVVGAEQYGYEYVLPAEYINIERIENGYIAYSDVNECAIYNTNGEKISQTYDYIDSDYEGGVTSARRGDKSFVLDTWGNVLSEYDGNILDLSGYVLVNLSEVNNDSRPPFYYEGEFGVYTHTGELLKTLPYEDFRQAKLSGIPLTFAGGRLMYKSDGKWGAIDENFNPVIEAKYNTIYPFYNSTGGLAVAEIDGKSGIIDRNGEVVVDFDYDWIEMSSSENQHIIYKLHKGELCGMADEYGKEIMKLSELTPNRYYDDVGLVAVYQQTEGDGVTIRQYGVTDCDGNVVIPVVYKNVSGIYDGVITVENNDGDTEYYDLDGNAAAEPGYRYWNGLAYIGEGKLIDKDENVVVSNPDWTSVRNTNWSNPYEDGRFEVAVGEKYGIARYTGFVSEWARETVDKAKLFGILDDSVSYDYTAPITREQFCEVVVSMAEKSGVEFEMENPQLPLGISDTDSVSVLKLYKAGVVLGKEQKKTGIIFAPQDFLTREEAATIIARLISKFYPDWAAHELYYVFEDEAEISDWAMNSIQRLCNMGIMNGVGDNRFMPKGTYTTEQAVATVMRVYDTAVDTIGGADGETDIFVAD